MLISYLTLISLFVEFVQIYVVVCLLCRISVDTIFKIHSEFQRITNFTSS